MTSVIEEIKTRLVRGESIEFISIHTGVSQENIRKVFKLK